MRHPTLITVLAVVLAGSGLLTVPFQPTFAAKLALEDTHLLLDRDKRRRAN